MKNSGLLVLILPLLLVVVGTRYLLHKDGNDGTRLTHNNKKTALQMTPHPGSTASFAVVELFTSEGCSSCPPADRLLGNLVAEADSNGTAVYPLSFHVDYWNRLGWSDPFSSPLYSARQRTYAHALKLDGLFTPQMVVNGRWSFVGSDASAAATHISEALQEEGNLKVTAEAKFLDDTVVVSFQATPSNASSSPADAIVNVALVERDLKVEVPRGENSGRTLHHDNVVRAFESVRPTGLPQGTVNLAMPSSSNRSKMSVVVYVQDPETMVVVGATRVIPSLP